jgi:zeta-carotene desaturase
VFYELFLKTSAGGRLGIPTIPLSEFYDSVALHFESLGGHLQQRASVDRLQPLSDGRWSVSAGEHTVEARNVILALPFEQTERLLAPLAAGNPAAAALSERISHFVHSPLISTTPGCSIRRSNGSSTSRRFAVTRLTAAAMSSWSSLVQRPSCL